MHGGSGRGGGIRVGDAGLGVGGGGGDEDEEEESFCLHGGNLPGQPRHICEMVKSCSVEDVAAEMETSMSREHEERDAHTFNRESNTAYGRRHMTKPQNVKEEEESDDHLSSSI
ncbi:unnamed protein product [Pleuronectes platessa]|uniref:Uncharacterized protein n=1 Tax=Pleuronectes platessa TaxID=8262 RepID=A0A9N7YZ42_PLEPL|nr:unnamed protein product [Pleuronectes platessa]